MGVEVAAILLVPLLWYDLQWVDPQGQVHFTDLPPPAGTVTVVASPHSPSVRHRPRYP
jgi:hypothetical protein